MDNMLYFFNLSEAQNVIVNATIQQIAEAPQRYFEPADIAWMLTSSVLVFLMIPGLALFYSGASNQRVTYLTAWLPLLTAAVVAIQWYVWGYALSFSNWPSSTSVVGGTDGVALSNVLFRPVPAGEGLERDGPYIPELLYSFFHGMFACFTAALVSIAAAWKDRPGHFLVFIVFWTTLVYDPIARSTWSPEGLSNQWGVLDFAGGTAVHITAGATVLAHCVFCLYVLSPVETLLSKVFRTERNPRNQPYRRPRNNAEAQNSVNVLLGTALLWVGWFGFNGGSALGANLRAVSACVSTHLAACAGGVTLCLLRAFSEHLDSKRKSAPAATTVENGDGPLTVTGPEQTPRSLVFSILEFCNGAIIGLICITPAAGYVPHQFAPVFGIVGALVLSQLTFVSVSLDDTLDVAVTHGIGGLLGMLLTGFLARGMVASLDGITNGEHNRGGWDGHWFQLVVQLVDAIAAFAYAFAVTMLILIFLEPFMFLSRGNRTRGARGGKGIAKPVEDIGTIREAPTEEYLATTRERISLYSLQQPGVSER